MWGYLTLCHCRLCANQQEMCLLLTIVSLRWMPDNPSRFNLSQIALQFLVSRPHRGAKDLETRSECLPES